MKAWHIAAIAVGVGAAVYIYRSTGGGFASIAAKPYVATGPAVESKRGIGHFAGATPVVAAMPSSGPAIESARGVGHF